MRAKLEDTVEITRAILRGCYQGNLEPWFSRLCSKSVWLGTGERILFGADAIRAHFEGYVMQPPIEILREEYYPVPLNSRCGAVAAEFTVARTEKAVPNATAIYTIVYQVIGAETKLILLHAGYEFLPSATKDDTPPEARMLNYQFVRDILLDVPEPPRVAIPAGTRTLFVQPNLIFYIQSKNKKAELYCADKVIQSSVSIAAVNTLLPPDFVPIHRCYTVNSRYVTAIRRYEVTMVTGEKLPVPLEAYNRVKAALQERITGRREPGGA